MKSPSFQFYPVEYLSDATVAAMTLRERGALMRRIMQAVERHDIAYLKSFKFIGRVYKGTSKRESLQPSIRKKVLSAGRCAHCDATERLTVDHIIPYSKGGGHDLSNLQCLCWPCNRRKGDSWPSR